MDKKTLEELIDQLEHDVANYATTSKAAESLRDAAAKGEDIDGAVEALVHALATDAQVPLIEAAASALATHLVRTGQGKRLLAVFPRTRWCSYLSKALVAGIVRGLDLSPVLADIIAPKDQRHEAFKLSSVLVTYITITRREKRLLQVVSIALERDLEILVDVLTSFLNTNKTFDKVAVPFLLPILQKKGVKAEEAYEVARFCARAADKDQDIQPFVAALDELLAHSCVRVHALAAQALANFWLKKDEYASLDRLLRHDMAKVRCEAYGVLGRSIFLHMNTDCRVIDRLWAGLADGDQEVHSVSKEHIDRALKWKRAVTPSLEVVRLLAGNLGAKRGRAILVAYLEPLCEADVEKARAIQDILTEDTASMKQALGDPAVAHLLGMCRSIVGGTADMPCSICDALPREGAWYRRGDVPENIKRLRLDGEYRVCPECRTVYVTSYEGEWDDMSYDETWTLRRLTPTEAVAKLKGEEQAWQKSHLDERLDLQRARLEHPKKWLREDASWVLTSHHCSQGEWKAIASMVDHADGDVRLHAIETLYRRMVETGTAVPLELFQKGLEDEVVVVRRAAVIAVTHRCLQQGLDGPIHDLVQSTDVETAAAAVFELESMAGKGSDISDFAQDLLTLAGHDNTKLRRAVHRALSRITKSEHLATTAVALFVEKLSSHNNDLRNDACDSLASLASEGCDISPALPALAELLTNEAPVWHANKALTAAARAEIDMSAVLPAIAPVILRGPSSQNSWLLRYITDKAEKGHDLSVLSDELENALWVVDGYERACLARVLTRQCILDGNWGRIRTLLKHSQNVRSGVCEILYQAARAGTDITGIVLDIPPMLRSKNDVQRRQFAATLKIHLKTGRTREEVGELAACLAREQPTEERDELLELCKKAQASG